MDVLLHANSKNLLQQIKKETKTVFFTNDRLVLDVQTCEADCTRQLQNGFDIAILQSSKKIRHPNTYVITYDSLASAYDSRRVVKAASLGIYECLKESAQKALFLPSAQPFQDKKVQTPQKKQTLTLRELAPLIESNSYAYKKNQNALKTKQLEVDTAKSSFLPKLSVFSTYTQIDSDRAKYSQGRYAQKQTSAGLEFEQLLYSNEALSNIDIQTLQHTSQKHSLSASNDRLLYEAMMLYLKINSAKQQKKILQKKEQFLRKNLLFARQRAQIGMKNKSDIYRFESEIARVQTDMSDLSQQIQSMKFDLFNALGLDKDYTLATQGITDGAFTLLGREAIVSLQDKNVREYFFSLAKKHHPRLRQLKTALMAKKEQIQMHQGQFYQPTLALQGSYEKSLDKSGAGANFPSPTDDEQFQAGVKLSFDLFDSSLKSINLQKSRLGYRDLQYSYAQTRDEIMKNIKTHYYFLQRSYDNISYLNAAKKAANNSLELVQNKYDAQKAAVTGLLDAQNAYETARLKHTTAKTKYLQNLVSFYFFCGQIDLLVQKQSKTRIEQKIQHVLHKGTP